MALYFTEAYTVLTQVDIVWSPTSYTLNFHCLNTLTENWAWSFIFLVVVRIVRWSWQLFTGYGDTLVDLWTWITFTWHVFHPRRRVRNGKLLCMAARAVTVRFCANVVLSSRSSRTFLWPLSLNILQRVYFTAATVTIISKSEVNMCAKDSMQRMICITKTTLDKKVKKHTTFI